MGKKTIDNHVKRLLASRICNPKNSFSTYNEIGAGEYGKVYRACVTEKCLDTIAVKNSRQNMSAEYLITKRLDKMGVPQVYGYDKCANRDFLFSEFINGVTLKQFLTKRRAPVTDVELRSIIIQVLYILYTIQEKYPSFRHHDLHMENVMILKKRTSKATAFDDAKLEVKLMDFGLATMHGVINPLVRSSTFKTEHGIYPRSDKAYDVHLFLSSLYATTRITPAAKRFIERIFRPEYLVKTSGVVNEFRLRHDVDHRSLPSIPDIMEDPYFKPTVREIIDALPAPKKAPPPVVVAAKKKSPVNQNTAKRMAMAVLKKMANAKKVPPVKKKAPVFKKSTLMRSPTKPLMVTK